MTLGIYNLRLWELGLHGDELDEMEEGDVYDALIERANDRETWEDAPTEDNSFMELV